MSDMDYMGSTMGWSMENSASTDVLPVGYGSAQAPRAAGPAVPPPGTTAVPPSMSGPPTMGPGAAYPQPPPPLAGMAAGPQGNPPQAMPGGFGVPGMQGAPSMQGMHGIDVMPAGTPAQALPGPNSPRLGPVAPGNDTNTPFWVGDGNTFPRPSRGVSQSPFPQQPAPTAPSAPPVLFGNLPALGGPSWQPRMITMKDGTVVRQYPDQSFDVISTVNPQLKSVRGKHISASVSGQQWGLIYREVGNYVPPILSTLLSTARSARGFVPGTPAAAAQPEAAPGANLPAPTAPTPEPEGLPTWVKVAGGTAAAVLVLVVVKRMLAPPVVVR